MYYLIYIGHNRLFLIFVIIMCSLVRKNVDMYYLISDN